MSLIDIVCSEQGIKVRMAISCHFFHTTVYGQSIFILKCALLNYRMLYSLGYYLKHKSIKKINFPAGNETHGIYSDRIISPYFLWVLTVRIWVSCLTPSTGLEKDGCKTKLKFRLWASQRGKEQSQNWNQQWGPMHHS